MKRNDQNLHDEIRHTLPINYLTHKNIRSPDLNGLLHQKELLYKPCLLFFPLSEEYFFVFQFPTNFFAKGNWVNFPM